MKDVKDYKYALYKGRVSYIEHIININPFTSIQGLKKFITGKNYEIGVQTEHKHSL